MQRSCALGIILILLVALAACGRGASAPVSLDASRTAPSALGAPGTDYDPAVLVVHYADGARVPAKLASLAPPPGKRASEQPFKIVRKYTQYEKLTDAAAAVAGLEIERQAYIDGMRMAAFRVPAGADPEQARQAILANLGGEITAVEYARYCHAAYTPNDPDFVASYIDGGYQWGQKRIGCEAAWDRTKGIPTVRIAVCDTGVRVSHEELRSSVLNPLDAFPDENLDVVNADNTVEDNVGHGSFIAGIIGAEQDNGRSITGVAPGCEIIPIKIANTGTTSDYLMAMGISLAVELGAKVINLSWGGPSGSATMQSMVETAYTNGVLLVVAAGNENTAAAAYPAAYEHCLCVGASKASDARSSFSNYGDYVDIAAPGEWLKSSLNEFDDDYEPYGAGTSYAAPIVAAAAGLLWSYSPQLSLAEVRSRLVENTVPTTGFSSTNPVGRLDIPAALDTIEELSIKPPKLQQLVHSGVVYFEPDVTGRPDAVELYLDDVLVETKTVAPYIFACNTSSINFGMATVDFATVRGGQRTFTSLDLLVDNTAGLFPIQDDFEDSATKALMGIDWKTLTPELLATVKTAPAENWTAEEVAANGLGQWSPRLDGGADGSRCTYCGIADSYGGYELDALVSRKVDLTQATLPVLTFQHHYNMEDGGQGYDRGCLYATSDGSQLVPVTNNEGAPIYFSGYEEDWQAEEINLSQFKGQVVNLIWLFESDGEVAGEEAGQPAVWWIDSVGLYNSINDGLPHVLDQVIEAHTEIGLVPELTTLELGLYSTQNVARASYTLDLAPVGEAGPEDISSGDVTSTFFRYSLAVPVDLPNQEAALIVEYADAAGTAGEPLVVPLLLYNKRGDCNGDGVVGEDDLAALAQGIGLAEGEVGFDPLLDTDGDGLITELDAAYLAYFWGG